MSIDTKCNLYTHCHLDRHTQFYVKLKRFNSIPIDCPVVRVSISLRPLSPSQNVADIKKMKLVGICTVKGIQMTTRKALCNIKGLSEAKVEKIKEAAGKMLVKKFILTVNYVFYVWP